MTKADLVQLVTDERVVQFFDDDGDGVVDAADTNLVSVLERAEAEYYSRMLRAYGDRQSMVDLANGDPAIKAHVAGIAMEFASERRPDFTSDDGWGPFKAYYQRAIDHFESLSKGRRRTIGQEAAGKAGTIGGQVSPAPPKGTTADFVFAHSNNAKYGRGGF